MVEKKEPWGVLREIVSDLAEAMMREGEQAFNSVRDKIKQVASDLSESEIIQKVKEAASSTADKTLRKSIEVLLMGISYEKNMSIFSALSEETIAGLGDISDKMGQHVTYYRSQVKATRALKHKTVKTIGDLIEVLKKIGEKKEGDIKRLESLPDEAPVIAIVHDYWACFFLKSPDYRHKPLDITLEIGEL